MPCLTFAQTSLLMVDGEVEKRLALSIEDLRAMPHQRGEVDDQGQRTTYEGVPLIEILRRAGLNIGRAPLRGKALTSVVFAIGGDGFQSLFALAELDSASTERRVLVADARDGRPLSSTEGPPAHRRTRGQVSGAIGSTGRSIDDRERGLPETWELSGSMNFA
jgi:DMSO/TMAO reductase YedYZ molybdopterin-dependent catalytic subunit